MYEIKREYYFELKIGLWLFLYLFAANLLPKKIFVDNLSEKNLTTQDKQSPPAHYLPNKLHH